MSKRKRDNTRQAEPEPCHHDSPVGDWNDEPGCHTRCPDRYNPDGLHDSDCVWFRRMVLGESAEGDRRLARALLEIEPAGIYRKGK